MTDAWTIIALHINKTLPDSLTARKALLRGLLWAMPKRHSTRAEIQAHLATIEAGETLQKDLPLKFQPPQTDGDGKGHHQ